MKNSGNNEVIKIDENGCLYLEEECNKRVYFQSTDIYSYGMVLYEIFSGQTPFEDMEESDVNCFLKC